MRTGGSAARRRAVAVGASPVARAAPSPALPAPRCATGRRGRSRPSRARSRSAACRCAGRGTPRGGPAVLRPLGERHLGDQLRLDPVCRAPRAACSANGVVAASRAPSSCLLQVAQRLRVEAGADVAGVAQPARLVVDAEQQRAEPGARALRVGVAADHELLALRALELDPVGRAARHVGRVARACRSRLRGAAGRRSRRISAASASKSWLKRDRARRRRSSSAREQRAPRPRAATSRRSWPSQYGRSKTK